MKNMRDSARLCALVVLLAGCVDDITFGTTGSGGSGAGTTTGAGGDQSGSGGATSTSASSVTSSNVSTGASGTCAGGGLCVPPAPPGWLGPTAYLPGASCGEGVPAVVSGGQGPSAAGACTCVMSGPAPCTTPTTTIYDTASCDKVNGDVAAGTTCTLVAFGQGADAASAAAIPAVNPATVCGQGGATPGVAFDAPASLCGGTDGTCANGDACLQAQTGELCVYTMGDVGCAEAGLYSVSHTLLTATTSCTCPPVSANCGGVTELYQGELCMAAGVLATMTHPNACAPTNGTVRAAKFIPTDATAFAGQCSSPAPTISTTTVTACCLP